MVKKPCPVPSVPPHRKTLQQATCVAILAASLAAPLPSEAASTITQSVGVASAVAGGAFLKASVVDAIRRYCHSSWRQARIPNHDWDDCTQDVMVELLTRLNGEEISQAVGDLDSEHRRELMRSVWCVAQRWRRANNKQSVSIDQLAEPSIAVNSDWEDVDLEKLDSAIDSLTPTQQTIMSRSRNGDSVAEIASSLDIPAPRVSDQKYKAIRKLHGMLTAS